MPFCTEIPPEAAGERSVKPSGDPRCLYFHKAVTCGHFQTKAILWVQKGENKPALKAENNARKDAAERRTELRSFKRAPGESAGRRRHGLIASKEWRIPQGLG